MRKFFALALAVAMVMSLAAVSFAETAGVNDVATVSLAAGPYRYDSDANVMIKPGTDKTDALRYGAGTYYLIQIGDDDNSLTAAAAAVAPVSTYKEIEKLKVKAEFEMGEDLVKSVSIVKKYVDKTADKDGDNTNGVQPYSIAALLPSSDYYYFVEFMVAKKETTSEADIIASLEFNRKADDDVKSTSNPTVKGIGKIDDVECDVEFTVFYKNNWNINGKIVTDRENLEWDTDYALKFENDDEIELSFGHKNDGNNEGTFTVDVSGQGKVYLRYNTKADEAIAAANPGVDMKFINFNNCKFNRVGEFVYEMDDIVAAYKVVNGKLVEIKGAEFDADSVTFNTRVLESYVFATAELVNPAAAVVEAPVVAAPAVTNPSTGA